MGRREGLRVGRSAAHVTLAAAPSPLDEWARRVAEKFVFFAPTPTPTETSDEQRAGWLGQGLGMRLLECDCGCVSAK